MASADRETSGAVDFHEQLHRAPHHFDFYQAMRRLECTHREQPRLGESLRPADDPVRFAQEVSLAFASSTLSSFAPGKNGRAWRLKTNFFGLFGPNGPLPTHLTEFARDRLRNANDPTFVRFLDLFVHRLLSLFYRCRAMAEPTIQFDRPETDRFHMYVGSLCGLGNEPLRNRDAMPDLAKLHFVGHLGCAARSAPRLQSLLSELLDAPAQVEEFVSNWMQLPENCRCKLGDSLSTGTLGESAIVGDRILDCQHKFRIVLGPLDRDQYEALLPGGQQLPFVAAIVRNFIGDELSWDLRLVLRRDKVSAVELGRSGNLGWTSWIGDYPIDHDSSELTLDPASSSRETVARQKSRERENVL